ncbi:MAG: Gfo/Idh/MocA family oxidoreductase [Phycisphaerae bacterium]|nr:Gfo/Idh/MocA family oxidoreductase [Phycisphaerae bacterium]
MVKVGLIGLGFMGYTHYQIYKKNRRAKVVAIGDYNRDKLEGDWSSVGGNLGDMAREKEDLSGIKTYANPLDMLGDPNVDVVDICLPTDLHHDMAIQALKSGKHVFSEKPMARNFKEAQEIAKAAGRAKGFYMVGHCIRFWPEYEVAKQIVDSGKYGRVEEVFLRRVANPPTYGDKNWFMNATRSGGGELDLHIHDADYALYLLGKPKRVWAWGSKGPSGGIDVVHAGLEYPRNVHVNIIGGWAYHAPFPFNMEFCIRCEKATLHYDMQEGKPLTIYTAAGKVIVPKVPAGTGWERELDYFLKCVEKNEKPTVVTAQSSLESVRLIDAEMRSIAAGKAVDYR